MKIASFLIAGFLLSASLLLQQSLLVQGLSSSQRDLQVNSVTGLELINAKTDAKILDLFNDRIIDMKSTSNLTATNFNINATVSGPVASVIFGYNETANFRTETSAPYAFCGNSGTDFCTCKQLGYGRHTVRATPTSGGKVGQTVSITFTIINGSPQAAPVSAPVTTPAQVPLGVPAAAPLGIPAPAPVGVPAPVVGVPAPVPVDVPAPAPLVAPVTTPVPVTAPVAGEAITGLRLMNAGVNASTALMNLTFDTVNEVDLLVHGLSSAQFDVDTLVSSSVKSVASAPLAYCGNSGNNFFPCSDLTLGATVTINVTAYSERYGQGAVFGQLTTTIHITRATPPVAPTPPTAASVAPPVIPPVPGCPLPWVSITKSSITLPINPS
jgi:hypothetical protein